LSSSSRANDATGDCTEARFVNALHKPLQGAFHCREAGELVTFGDKFFHPSLQHPSLQKHPTLAFEVFALASGSESGYFKRLRRFKSSSFHPASWIILFRVLGGKVSPG
jgi:hypothetical protein